MRRSATALAALAVLLLVGAAADAEVWRWSDARGVHFTDSLERVPPSHRDAAREITGALEARGSVVVPGLNAPRGPGSRAADGARDPDAAPEAGAAPDPEALARRVLGEKAPALIGLGIGVIVGFLVLTIPIGLAIQALFLMAACRLASDERPPFGRAFGVCGARFLASLVAGLAGAVASCAVGGPAALDGPLLDGISFLLTLGVNASLLASMLGLSLGRAAWVLVVEWLLLFAAAVVPLGLLLLLGLGAG
jgi:hypothetical protein